MRNRFVLFSAFVLLAATVFLSCKKTESEQQEEKPSAVMKVRIAPTISKVTETQFETGDAIGVTISMSSGDIYAQNARLEYDGTVFSGKLDWFPSDETCDINAYYPYSPTVSSNSFSVQSDQSAGLSASDYLTASLSNVKASATAVSMVFYHQTSRLEVQVTNHSGKQFAGLKLGGIRPDIALTKNQVEITPFLRDGKYYALIPEQEATLTLSFTLDGEARTASVPSALFRKGRQHTVNLVLNSEEAALASLSGDVDGWSNYGLLFPHDDFYTLLKKSHDQSLTYYFSRMYLFMSELRADNICVSVRSTDYFMHYSRYENPGSYDPQLWYIMNRVLDVANSIIAEPMTWDSQSAHLLGEAYFFRAFSHFTLVNLYARPYSVGKEDGGFPLKTEAGVTSTTVAAVYNLVVEDLLHAIEWMNGNDDPSKDHGYVTALAAKALLSRVYLYMERNADCETVCNELLGSDPSAWLVTDLDNYFKQARTQNETIWCIAYDQEESFGKGGIGSMFYGYETGWCEFFWSDPLIELFSRYPEDKRFLAYFHQYKKTNDGKKMVHWPIVEDGVNYRGNAVVHNLQPDADGNVTFSYNFQTYTTEKKSKAGVNNGYPQFFINYGGEETQVFVRDNVEMYIGVRAPSFPLYMMSKFSGQDGDNNLSSPVMLRWAEVILNRAEARAKLGNDAGALADVNILRRRAGLGDDALMSVSNYAARGYSNVLDVVLDERRMELCFEGHRFYDVYRNKKQMDRRFAGQQPWEVIEYTDSRIPYAIPVNE